MPCSQGACTQVLYADERPDGDDADLAGSDISDRKMVGKTPSHRTLLILDPGEPARHSWSRKL